MPEPEADAGRSRHHQAVPFRPLRLRRPAPRPWHHGGAGHAGGRGRAQHGHEHDQQVLHDAEVDAEEVGDEDRGECRVDRCAAVHLGGRAQRDRERGALTSPGSRASVDASIAKTVARITRAELIVIDDIGILPAGQAAGEAFYRVVDAAYERRSVAVTSNLHPAGFDTFMPKTLATAAVDRLLHHAHVIITEGTSLRLSEATAGRGVIPLN